MVDPEVAGTAFSVEVSTSYPSVHIAASYGLGEAVVSGRVTSDEWLLHPENLSIIKNVCGSKKETCCFKKGESGIEWVDTPLEKTQKLCMADSVVNEVGKVTRNVQKVYKTMYGYEHVDTEFAVTKEGQVRAL
jgi:pyruvate,water dikinase